MNFPTLPDITASADIKRLGNTFYDRVQEDDLLGFIFNDVAKTNWSTHLPRMDAFWETVLIGTGEYRGNR